MLLLPDPAACSKYRYAIEGVASVVRIVVDESRSLFGIGCATEQLSVVPETLFRQQMAAFENADDSNQCRLRVTSPVESTDWVQYESW